MLNQAPPHNLLASHDLPASALELELTESTLLDAGAGVLKIDQGYLFSRPIHAEARFRYRRPSPEGFKRGKSDRRLAGFTD